MTDLSQILTSKFNFKNISLTSSGTAAIDLVLKAVPQDCINIGIANNTCFQVLIPILKNNKNPVFLDIETTDHLISFDSIKKNNIDLLIFPYTYGFSRNISDISIYCKKNNILLIEDICPSFGATNNENRLLGTTGDLTIGSFGHGKIVSCNYGGFIGYNSLELYEKIHKLEKLLPMKSDYEDLINKISSEFTKIYNSGYLNQDWDSCRNFNKIIQNNLFTYSQFSNQMEQIIIQSLSNFENSKNQRLLNWSRTETWIEKNYNLMMIPTLPPGSIPWRFIFLTQNSSRNKILRLALQNKIPISSWFCTLSRFYDGTSNTPNVDKISDEILNLWLIESPKNYFSALEETFSQSLNH